MRDDFFPYRLAEIKAIVLKRRVFLVDLRPLKSPSRTGGSWGRVPDLDVPRAKARYSLPERATGAALCSL
jgi:hypothetical protein